MESSHLFLSFTNSVLSIKYNVTIYSFLEFVYLPYTLYVLFPISIVLLTPWFLSSSLFSISSFISLNKSVNFVLISTFINSLTNVLLLHITFPFVSAIIRGNGEFIKVVFAALSPLKVKSFIWFDNSDFLFLSLHKVYAMIKAYKIIDGIINLISCIHTNINKTKIIAKYIFVLETNLSNTFYCYWTYYSPFYKFLNSIS